MSIPHEELDIRVIDQRIGVGVGGMDTVIRIYHKPTGLLVEVPRLTSSQYYDRQIGLDILELILTDSRVNYE